MIKSRHLRQGFYREGSWHSPFFIVTLRAIEKEGLHIRKFMGFTGTEDDLAIPKVNFQRNLAKKITVWMQNCHYIRSGFKVGIYDCCGDPVIHKAVRIGLWQSLTFMGDTLEAKLGFCFGQWFLLYQKQKKAFIGVSIKDSEIQNVKLLRGTRGVIGSCLSSMTSMIFLNLL